MSRFCSKHGKWFGSGTICEDCIKDVPQLSEDIQKELQKAFPVSTVTTDSHDLKVKDGAFSARHNEGKTQVREIDPDFILGIGDVLTASRTKYSEGNWMKETKFSTPYESCMRHLQKFWNGEELDEETKRHHLLHAATNLMFLYYHTDSGKGIDDRLFKKEKK
jgi:hypothetical protein